MDFIFKFLAVHILFLITIHGLDVPCEGNGHDIHWICDEDQNSGKLNVTYDCNLNNDTVTKIFFLAHFVKPQNLFLDFFIGC